MKRLPEPAPDTPTLDQLREVFLSAQSDTAARWGKMDCTQMTKHCRDFVDLYLGRVHVSLPVRLIARMMGPLFLARTIRKSPTETPKNLSTLPGLRAAADHELDFAEERRGLLAALAEVEALSGVQAHPLYGQVAAEDMIALVRHHTAHHANQFGLLS